MRTNNLSEKKQLTLGSLFDGIGGFPYAASFYGIRPLWASEIDPVCAAITKRRIPDMVHLGDITRLHGGTVPPVDILTFGSPCQGFSLCGSRRGMADARSGLFMEAIRIIREMQEETHGEYPQFSILENVPGILSSNGRRDYQAVLAAFTGSKIPMPQSGRWASAGMVRGRDADLAWIMYDARHFWTAQRRRRLFLVCDFRGTRSAEILFVPKSLRGYFEAGGTPGQGITAFAESGAGAAGAIIDSPVPHGLRPLCMATGQTNATILDDQSPTLTAAHERPLLIHPRLAGTLCASGAGLSRPAGMGSESDFCIVSAAFKHKASAAAGSTGYQEETAPPLISTGDGSRDPIHISFQLRRLSPTETERLMGFPDFWTAYGSNSKPISDSKRFSMLGNSVAVPCVAYIMQGITDALGRGGSL